MITKVNCSSAGPERGTKGRLRKKKKIMEKTIIRLIPTPIVDNGKKESNSF